jgi:hypothetical protein
MMTAAFAGRNMGEVFPVVSVVAKLISKDGHGMSEERGRPDRRIRTDRRKYDRQTESEQTDAGRTDRRNRIKQDADRSQTR